MGCKATVATRVTPGRFLAVWLIAILGAFAAETPPPALSPSNGPALSPSNGPGATTEITALLTTQAAAWNRGDIDGFMQAYAATEDLRFASGGKVTYGWRATLEGYKKRYPDKATMGTLAFTDLVVTTLAPDAALVFGRWKLTREKDTPNGLFTLTLKKTADGWRIIQDHTSSAGG